MLHKFGLWGGHSINGQQFLARFQALGLRVRSAFDVRDKAAAPDHLVLESKIQGKGPVRRTKCCVRIIQSAHCHCNLRQRVVQRIGLCDLDLSLRNRRVPVHSVQFRTIIVFLNSLRYVVQNAQRAFTIEFGDCSRPGLRRRGGLLRFQKRERQHHYHYYEKHSISPRHRSRLQEATGARQIPH